MYNIPVPVEKKWIESFLKISSLAEIGLIKTNNLLKFTFHSTANDLFLEAPEKYSVRALLLKDIKDHRRLYFFKGKEINTPFIEKKRLIIEKLKDQSGKSDSDKDVYIRLQKDIYKFIVNSSLYENLVFDSCLDYEWDEKVNSAIKQYEDYELKNNNVNIKNIIYKQPRKTSTINKTFSDTKSDNTKDKCNTEDSFKKLDEDITEIEKLLPKKFNKSCYFFVNHKENYLMCCNEFARKLMKPTYSGLLLFLHISYMFSEGKEGIYILGKKFSSYKDKLNKMYPNTINRKINEDKVKKFEKSIKRILDGKKELTKAEKESIAVALVLAKIVENERVQQFLKSYQL